MKRLLCTLLLCAFPLSGMSAKMTEERQTASGETAELKLDVWGHLINLGAAGIPAVNTAMQGHKPAEADMTKLNEAYVKLRETLKNDKDRQIVDRLQAQLENLLNQPEEFNTLMTDEQIVLATVATHSSPLHVREHAGVEAQSLGAMPKGTLAQVLEPGGDWMKIRGADNMHGYASSEYLKLLSPCIYGIVETHSNPLNIRTESNSSSNVLVQVEKGATLCVLETDGNWLKIKYKTHIGYAFKQYVKLP